MPSIHNVDTKLKHKQQGAAAGLSDIAFGNGLVAYLDRSLKFGAADVTGPDVVDAAAEIEA